MKTINLKQFYPWYEHDEYIDVSDEVAKELAAGKRYEAAYQKRIRRHKAYYSLDVGDGIEYAVCTMEPSPAELLLRQEQFEQLCRALNTLSEKQGRRVEANVLRGKKIVEIAQEEGVSARAVSESIRRCLENMRKFLKEMK